MADTQNKLNECINAFDAGSQLAESIFNSLSHQVQNLSSSTQQSEGTLKTVSGLLQQQVDAVQGVMSEQKSHFESLAKISNQMAGFHCPNSKIIKDLVKATTNIYHIWVIEDIREKMQDWKANPEEFQSPSTVFYTCRIGYKIQARMQFSEEAIIVRLGFCKGNYDDLLVWPFDQKIEVHILSHLEGREPIKEAITPNNDDPNQANLWKKPTSTDAEYFYDIYFTRNDVVGADSEYFSDFLRDGRVMIKIKVLEKE